MEQILIHTSAVSRAANTAMVVGDMPFLSYQISEEEGMRNAGRLIKEAGADAVKLEGGRRITGLITRLVDAGIPVMGHLGLTPQSIKTMGGYSLQAKNTDDRKRLLEEAKLLEEAGAFSIVLEMIPSDLAKEVSQSLRIPTIGIGAGKECDGQVLVTQDLLGLFEGFKPKFVRHYARMAQQVRDAAGQFIKDVKNREFPGTDESF